MNRMIISSFFILSAIAAFAYPKLTVRNANAGDSSEVSVKDGLVINEINSEWLDSVPYLTEHARRGETWAYNALAECHCYGKGGLKVSFINTLTYYDLAGKNMEDCMAEIKRDNPDDLLAVFSRLLDYLENNDLDLALCAVDTLDQAGYHSADIFVKALGSSGKIDTEDLIEYVKDPETDPDASLFACAGYVLTKSKDSEKIDLSWAAPLLMVKIPFLYNMEGRKLYAKTIKSDTPDGYEEAVPAQDIEDRRKAAEYFLKADERGALSREAARLLWHYFDNDSSSLWMKLSKDEKARIRKLAETE